MFITDKKFFRKMKRILFLILILDAIALRAQDTILVHPTAPIATDFTGEGLMWDCSSASSDIDEMICFRPDKYNPMAFSAYDGYTHFHLFQQRDSTFLTGYENQLFKIALSHPALRFTSLIYGDTAVTDFTGEGEYCHSSTYQIVGSAYLTTDAVGTIWLPCGKFNVTRSRFHRDIMMIGSDTVNILEDTYQWFTPTIPFPLFEQHEVRELWGETDSLVVCQAYLYDLSEEELMRISLDDSLLLSQTPVISSLSHMPNPVIADMFASYTLGVHAAVTLILTTSAGLPMWSSDIGWQEAGEHVVSIDMSRFPRGTYELHVCAGGLTVSETIIKL